MKIQYLSRDQILTEAQDLYGRWQTLTTDERRQIVEQLVEHITVDEDEVRTDLCYLPCSSEIMAKGHRDFTAAL